MEDKLKKIINVSTNILEQEDKYLIDAFEKNKRVYPNKSGGLRRCNFNNERFYQFVIAKGLIKEYEKPIALEKDTYDLVVYGDYDESYYETIVEMKRWFSPNGEAEISGIKRDIEEKLATTKSQYSLMLIFSANAKAEEIEENIKWLAEQLDIPYDENDWFWNSFETKDEEGNDIVFWVAGYQVK